MWWIFCALAAELPLEATVAEGVDATMRLSVTDGNAKLQIENLGDVPLVIDWEQSSIAPIGAEAGDLVPGGEIRPAPDVLIAPMELSPGAVAEVRPIPRNWLADGTDNDTSQWATWSDPGTATISLTLQTPTGTGSLRSTWRQSGPAPAVALAIPALSSQENAAYLAKQAEWERAHTGLRRQQKFARTFWRVSGSIALASGALAGLTAASISEAPVDPPEGETSRADTRQAAAVYGVLSGVCITIAVPNLIWDVSAGKKRRKLGPRP